MRNIKRDYQSRKKTKDDFLYAWIDHFQVTRDENDKYVYALWGVAINCPDLLEEYRKMEAFTFMEAVIFNSLIILNFFGYKKPNAYEIVKDRYFEKLKDAVELHLLDTIINVETFIEERSQFYYQQILELQNNKLPSKIFSAFYDDDFYEDPDSIPIHKDNEEVKIFNKYLNKMFTAANQGSINVCQK